MRILVLVINMVVSVSLLGYPAEMLAASKHKGSHKVHGKGKRLRGRGKAVVHEPINIWDRIRYGMRLPKPSPPMSFSSLHRATPIVDRQDPISDKQPVSGQAPVDEKLEAATLESKYTRLGMQHQLSSRNRLVEPGTISTPIQNYTRYGRQRLNMSRPSMADANASISSTLQSRSRRLLQPNPNYLTPGANSRTRIRTQLAPPVGGMASQRPMIHSEVIARGAEPPIAPADNAAKNTDIGRMPPQIERRSSSINGMYVPNTGAVDRQQTREEALWQRQATIYGRFKRQVNGYAQNPDYLSRVAERSRPYIYHVVEEFNKYGMPLDLTLLPVVESAYQATALSPMSAAGIWQFIPGTGRDFNLVQNGNYDGRLDVTASTRAAARFLSGLKSHFGDWLLALAAYNCGQGTVDAAISANRAAGLGTDYWSLNLPAETMDYVPRLLAVAHIFSNPGAYGVRLKPVRNEPYFVKVRLDRKMDIDFLTGKDLTTVAQMANMDYGHFCRLNPGFIQPKLTKDGPFSFLLPGANASQLRDRLDGIAKFLGQPAPLPKNAPVNPEAFKAATPVAIPTAVSAIATAAPVKPAIASSPFVSLQVDGAKNKPVQSLPGVVDSFATSVK